jgi:hypothetical protein
MKMFFYQLASETVRAGSGGSTDLSTILYAVFDSILPLALLVVAFGGVRAAMALSHAEDDVQGAKHKKRFVNCIIAAAVIAVALIAVNVVASMANSWVS